MRTWAPVATGISPPLSSMRPRQERACEHEGAEIDLMELARNINAYVNVRSWG